MDAKTVKLNCLTLGELENEPIFKECPFKSRGVKTFEQDDVFLILLKYNVFNLVLPFRSDRRYVHDKLSTIYLDLQIPALNASCFLLEHQ